MEQEKKVIAAAQRGDIEALKGLLAEGANINEQDEQGWTALHWSAGKGDVDTVKLLLEQQADVTLTGRDNRTAFMVARAAGNQQAAATIAEAEKARGVWKDPRENKPYCKAYYWKDIARYPHWPSSGSRENGQEQQADADSIVYLHQDFTVTKSVWMGESVIFRNVTPEWVRFCESELKFAIPADLA
jgi:hypothetical protein